MDRDFNRDGKIDWYDKLIEQELLYDDDDEDELELELYDDDDEDELEFDEDDDDNYDEDENDEDENCSIMEKLERMGIIAVVRALEIMQEELNEIQKFAERKQMNCEKMQAGTEKMRKAAERQLMNIKKLKSINKEMRELVDYRLMLMKTSGKIDDQAERWDYLLKTELELIEKVRANDVSDAG